MKKSKLIIILVSVFAVVAIIIGTVVGIYSQLEKNPVSEGEPLVKVVDENTLGYNEKTYKSGDIVTVKDEKLSQCLLLLDKQMSEDEIFSSKYAPLFSKEEKVEYFLRDLGNLIVEKKTLGKSKYENKAYSAETYTLPELDEKNIKHIQVCYGNYYDEVKNPIEGFASGVSAVIDGNCPVFDLKIYAGIDTEQGIKDFIREFETTGGLEASYKKWSQHSGKENVFFKVVFFEDIPCSLVFTKDAITID